MKTAKKPPARSAEPAQAPRKPLSQLSPSARGLVSLACDIFKAHLTILDTEAALFRQSRSGFIEMLLKRRLGLLDFNRPATAPVYEFTDKDLTKVHVAWYWKPDVKKLFDDDKTRLGDLSTSAWIAVTLNAWIDSPDGLPLKAKKK